MSSPKVQFHYLVDRFNLRDRSRLKKFIGSIFKKEKRVLDRLDYIFCSDQYLLGINREFLQHDFFTDIISFDLSDGSELKGEIYISIDRIKDNSTRFGTSFAQELHRVLFHGALHLCGYKDKKKKDQLIMRAKEDEYLSIYFK